MKQLKKASIIFCVLIMLVSALAVPVSAATQDHYHLFTWDESNRFGVTDTHQKADDSATYFRVINNSMPMDGFYMATILGPSGGPDTVSSSYYLITTYGGKTIKHNKTATGMQAGLKSYYPAEHWSWGDVTIAWSEDYSEDGSARLNW